MKPVEEQGFVIVAVSTPDADYIQFARRLARSIRHWHRDARICLVTDHDLHDSNFDHVKKLMHVDSNPYANDWQAFRLSPFRETIKLEADMLITSDINHWWTMMRHREVVISTGCRDWKDQPGNNQQHRRVFVENNLADVYNAITYWRISKTATDFFRYVRDIFERWDEYKKMIKFAEDVPSTDLVYAMAAEIVGRESVTLPFATYPKIVHMKSHVAGTENRDWTRELVWEIHEHELRINTVAQWGAFHYHVKDWQP